MSCDGNCGCESGKFGCSCCCASVTGLRGGIHPDTIRSEFVDLVLDEVSSLTRTYSARVILAKPIHIVSVDMSLMAVFRDLDEADQAKQILSPTTLQNATIAASVPASAALYTIAGFKPSQLEDGGWNSADPETRNYTGSVTSHAPSWQSHPDLFGYFADGALFVEYNAPNQYLGMRVVVNYVNRLQFPPAYHDPLDVMQHYWKCSHGDTEFLEGFYGGTEQNIASGDSSAEESRGGTSRATDVFDPSSDTHGSWKVP
jgi:hypothetical protein